MERPRLSVSPWAALCAGLFFYAADGALLRAMLPAVLVHELGHALALRLSGGRIRELRLEPGGFCIRYASRPDRRGEILSAAAGPAAGLLYAPAAACFGPGGELSAGVSLLLSVFNLLPAPPLDGGRILESLLCARLGSRRGEGVCRSLGFGVGLALCACGLVFALKGKWAAPLIPGLWLLLREDL
jgi:Zn-dependent protease